MLHQYIAEHVESCCVLLHGENATAQPDTAGARSPIAGEWDRVHDVVQVGPLVWRTSSRSSFTDCCAPTLVVLCAELLYGRDATWQRVEVTGGGETRGKLFTVDITSVHVIKVYFIRTFSFSSNVLP